MQKYLKVSHATVGAAVWRGQPAVSSTIVFVIVLINTTFIIVISYYGKPCPTRVHWWQGGVTMVNKVLVAMETLFCSNWLVQWFGFWLAVSPHQSTWFVCITCCFSYVLIFFNYYCYHYYIIMYFRTYKMNSMWMYIQAIKKHLKQTPWLSNRWHTQIQAHTHTQKEQKTVHMCYLEKRVYRDAAPTLIGESLSRTRLCTLMPVWVTVFLPSSHLSALIWAACSRLRRGQYCWVDPWLLLSHRVLR